MVVAAMPDGSTRGATAARVVLVAAAVVGAASTAAVAQQAPHGRAPRDADAGNAASVASNGDGGAASDAGAPDGPGWPAESLESRRVRAGAEFAEGLEAYRRGDFVTAATHFENAYLALPDPAPLFNMARSWEGANEVARAVEAYERYLAAAPNAPDRNQVVERIAILRSRPAQVFISSEPPGARVFIDDDPSPQPSTTPMVVRLPPGPHVITLEREGTARTQRRFVARPGEVETLALTLPREEEAPPALAPGRGDARITGRRTATLFTPRLSFLLGAARPWSGQPLALSLAGEVGGYVGRWGAGKLRLERIEPDGVWTIVTGDVGVVYALEDLDLSLFATMGAGYGWLDFGAYNRGGAQQWSGVAGVEARAEWVFHPRLSLGLVFRLMARNIFVAPVEPLNSFALSVSLLP
jgi:hypothetical protein